jgi:hypothetical protein
MDNDLRRLNHLTVAGVTGVAWTDGAAAGAFFAAFAFLGAFFVLLTGFTSAFGASTFAATGAAAGATTTGAAGLAIASTAFGASAAIATEANNAETSITIDLFIILISFYI